MTAAEEFPSQRQQLATSLRRLREGVRPKLSTYKLAALLGLSQSRVSRMETGRAIPQPENVEKWARFCGAGDEEIARLVALATDARTVTTLWQSSQAGGLVKQQKLIGEREREAGVIRAFHPSGIWAGLLQTADYMRHVLAFTGSPDQAAGAAARLRRQAVLHDPAKTFEFLLHEAALRFRPGPAPMLVAQLAHIGNLMTLPNVTVGLIPMSAEAPTFYSQGFTLYEERAGEEDPLVEVETVEGERLSTDPRIVAAYANVLKLLRTVALYDDDARALLASIAEDLRSG